MKKWESWAWLAKYAALMKGAGCLLGTDQKAPEALERIKKTVGMSCPVLGYAIKRKLDHSSNVPNSLAKSIVRGILTVR